MPPRLLEFTGISYLRQVGVPPSLTILTVFTNILLVRSASSSLHLVPWRGTWKISTPEFDDEQPSPLSVSPEAVREPHLYASFGEVALAVLGLQSPPSVRHFLWHEKTPIAIVPSSSVAQAPMAYHLVDSGLFMPQGAQHLMIPGRSLVKRVVIGVIRERNNDLAIAIFNPLPQHHIAFEDIKLKLDDFLSAENGIPYQSI